MAGALLLTGCPGPGPIKLEPIPRPPGVMARVDGEVERTALALNGGTLLLSLVKKGTTDPIANASFSLVGPTLGKGETRQGTGISFGPLIPGSYVLRVSAPGYKTLVEGNITLEAKQTLERRLAMEPEGGKVTGLVKAEGKPVWGARVLLGDAWTFTGQDGSFSLSGVGAGSGTLSIRKGGFKPLNHPLTVSGPTAAGTLNLAEGDDRTVWLVNGAEPFGGGVNRVDTELSALMAEVDKAGGKLKRAVSQKNANVRLVASPKAALDPVETRNFVAGGGTLIVTGEWGGFGDYNPETVNALIRPFGLAVRPDLVRISGQATESEWFTAALNTALPLAKGVSGLSLHTSCSIMASPMALTLADSGSGGYRVQAAGAGVQTLAAAVPHGDGLVVVLGDTSAWTGSHLNKAGNRQFMLNLFGW